MKKYIVPELEISKFSMQDVVTSPSDPVVTPEFTVDAGAPALFDGNGNYSKNDLKWTNDF